MKYYIYISDAKVDMLVPQLPHDIKKKVVSNHHDSARNIAASTIVPPQ
jgi:hypothetical protein